MTTNQGNIQEYYQINEFDQTPPINLSVEAINTIKSKINRGKKRLGLKFDDQGKGIISSNSHVGVVGLPNGPTIEITPKEDVTNLLRLIAYSENIRVDPILEPTRVTTGGQFLDAIALLFESELDSVLSQGLKREYVPVNRTEQYLRGRLRVSDQLRNHTLAPTKFECRYQNYSFDNLINRAILQATSVLVKISQSATIISKLNKHKANLERVVSTKQVTSAELQAFQINRLNEYYDNLYRITQFIIDGAYIGDITDGLYTSCSLLFNMNNAFEKTVVRATKESINNRPDLSVESQYNKGNVLIEEQLDIQIRPDFVILDANMEVILVGDAKWKTGSPSNQDIYQILAYQQVFDSPAMLVYPKQNNSSIEIHSKTSRGEKLSIVELPLAVSDHKAMDFGRRIESRIRTELDYLIGDIMDPDDEYPSNSNILSVDVN